MSLLFFIALSGCGNPCHAYADALATCYEDYVDSIDMGGMDIELDPDSVCNDYHPTPKDNKAMRCAADALDDSDCSSSMGYYGATVDAAGCFL